MSILLLNSNALHIPLADKSVHCVVTSPPYWGLRDYGIGGQLGLEQTPEQYVENMVAVFREVKRVLRDDGTCWLNLGDSYAGSSMSGGPQEGRVGGETKQLDLIKGCSKGVGTGVPVGLKPKDLVGIPWRVAFALQADGWYLRSDIIWHKPNPMPESVTDRPTKSHEYVFLLSKSERYFYDQEAVRESVGPMKAVGKAYSFKRNVNENPPPGQPSQHRASREDVEYSGTRNRRTVWTVATIGYAGAHFATYPPALVEPCILAGSRVGDVVLDPFAGSGTTLLVARKLGRHGIGLDLSYTYLHDQARARLDLTALDEWENGVQAGDNGYHGLPLFGGPEN